MDKSGTSDTYVVLSLASHTAARTWPTHKTKCKSRTLTPCWDKGDERRVEYELSEAEGAGRVSLRCFDRDKKGEDEPMGDAHVDVAALVAGEGGAPGQFPGSRGRRTAPFFHCSLLCGTPVPRGFTSRS